MRRGDRTSGEMPTSLRATADPPPQLTRTPSFDADDHYRTEKVECVASHFVVCGLAPGVLEPLNLVADGAVLDAACIVLPGRGEECPPGFALLSEPNGARISLNQGNVLGWEVLLAVRRASRLHAAQPLTGLAIIHGDETPPRGYEPLLTSVGGGDASLNGGAGRELYLCVSRQTRRADAHGDEVAPLREVTVLRRAKATKEPAVPPGFEVIRGNTNMGALSGQPIFLAVARAAPCGLTHTPLKPALLDLLTVRDRPVLRTRTPTSPGTPDVPSSRWDDDGESCSDDDVDCFTETNNALPQALPHFCLPRGAHIRTVCPWPTAHDFCLTDSKGKRLYGTTITTWEPILGVLTLQRSLTIDEQLRLRTRRSSTRTVCSAADGALDCGGGGGGGGGAASDEAYACTYSYTYNSALGRHTASSSSLGESESGETSAETDVYRWAVRRDDVEDRWLDASTENQDVKHPPEADAAALEMIRLAFLDSNSDSNRRTVRLYDSPQAVPPADEVAIKARSRLVVRGARLFAPKTLTILSRYPFLTSLRRWLCQLYRHSLSASNTPLERLIGTLLWECPLPPPGHISVCISIGGELIRFSRPSLAQELDVSELRLGSLLYALPPSELLRLFSAACVENKLIIVSKFASQLAAAAEAVCALLWPMRWQGVYIPLLPVAMIEILQSPVPFVLGLSPEALEDASVMGLLPDDAVIARLDQGTVHVPSCLGTVVHLPNSHLLASSLEMFRSNIASSREERFSMSEDSGEAYQADLAFPHREQGKEAAERRDAARVAAQRMVCHTFAGWWAILLRGYHQFVRWAIDDHNIGIDSIIDSAALIASRAFDERELVSRLVQTQAFSCLVEQRTQFSSRDAELVLFDFLVEQSTASPRRLPQFPEHRMLSREYRVPPPPTDGEGTSGPFEGWPRLRRHLLVLPRPIPPLNFESAPPIHSKARGVAAPSSPKASRATSELQVAVNKGWQTPSSPNSKPGHRRVRSHPNNNFFNMSGLLGGSTKIQIGKINEGSPQSKSSSRLFSLAQASPTMFTPPAPILASAWARERVGEVYACMLVCYALVIPKSDAPTRAFDAALAHLDRLQDEGVAPPQCAYHALLRACSRCGLVECSRALFEQFKKGGRKPDAQTLGWYSHSLIESSFLSHGHPHHASLATGEDTPATAPASDDPTVAATGMSIPSTSRRKGGKPPPSPGRRHARLRVDATCEGCNRRLNARDALSGWLSQAQVAGYSPGYACECPVCHSVWQPELIIDLSNSSASSATSNVIRCAFLSPTVLLQELLVLLESSSGRRALLNGWRLSRHLFPSVFWNLAWHLAPEGLLSMLPHFMLAPLPYEMQPFSKLHESTGNAACERTNSAGSSEQDATATDILEGVEEDGDGDEARDGVAGNHSEQRQNQVFQRRLFRLASTAASPSVELVLVHDSQLDSRNDDDDDDCDNDPQSRSTPSWPHASKPSTVAGFDGWVDDWGFFRIGPPRRTGGESPAPKAVLAEALRDGSPVRSSTLSVSHNLSFPEQELPMDPPMIVTGASL